jgi:hypothetical protein
MQCFKTIVQIDPQICQMMSRKKLVLQVLSFTNRSPFHIFAAVVHESFLSIKTRIMSWFEYRDGVLLAEDVRVHTLADRFSTPLYVYSKAGIEHNLKAYQEAMEVG